MKTWRQVPGQMYIFRNKKTGEEDTVVLPLVYGESNDFVFWCPRKDGKHKNGGTWASAKFHRINSFHRRFATGPAGLLGRMRYLLISSRNNSKFNNYAGPATTPEEMYNQWLKQDGKCIACAESLDIFEAHYDHNHKTGGGRGFAHSRCNHIEGFFTKLSDKALEKYIIFIRKIRLDNKTEI